MKHELTAKRLSKALDEAGLIPQELSVKSGVNKSSISQYINGTHKPSNISAGKMGTVLNVDPMWLMGFDVPKRKNNEEKIASTMVDVLYEDKHLIEINEHMKKMSDKTKERLVRYAKFLLEEQEND